MGKPFIPLSLQSKVGGGILLPVTRWMHHRP